MTRNEEYCEYCGKIEEDCECDEEVPTTLEDVNNFLDTANKGLDFLNKLKKQTNPSEANLNKFNTSPPRFEISDSKSPSSSDAGEEKRHRETIKWTKIGIGVGAIVAITLGTVAIIFN